MKPMRSVAPDAKYPINYPMLMSRKLDGIRFCKYKGQALSKSLKPIPNHHIRNWIEANVPEGVDGEIISGPPNLETTYGATFKAVMTHDGEPEFSLYVFDLCNMENAYAIDRLQNLESMIRNRDSRIILVEQTMVHNQEQMEKTYDKFLQEGYEGAILKLPTGLYKYGRATPKDQIQLKLKPEEDFEGRILSMYEAMTNENEAFINEVGETERSTHQEHKVPKGMLGGFRIETLLEPRVQFDVGPGKMKHQERIDVWNEYQKNPSKFVGRLIKYRAMGYGEMTNGAARHPRFYGWRDQIDM
jgi:DNA ligase-1